MLAAAAALAQQPQGAKPTYDDDLRFLAAHTDVLELTDDHGARVAVCPKYQGRVMTSTAQGPKGTSFGWINRPFISAGEKDTVFNNYGGEDRFWLSPEAGQFALFFAPDAEQTLANWRTPPGLNEGSFRLASGRREPFYRLTARRQFVNAAGTSFDVEISRTIRLIGLARAAELLGAPLTGLVQDGKTRRLGMVAFCSENTIINVGAAMTQESGLLSIWTLGQFPPGEQTVIVAPYRPGDDSELGPVVTGDYFAAPGPERLKVTPAAVLFKGDGRFRSKIGISPRRARPAAGSIDFAAGVLTIVHYSLPADADDLLYLNNAWALPQAEPYRGDAFNSYNDGPAEPGADTLGGFYELETLSPARPLATGDRLTHTHATFHFQGELADLAKIAQAVLGIDLEEARAAFR